MPLSFVKAPSAEATQWLEGLGKAKGEDGDTVFSYSQRFGQTAKCGNSILVPKITLPENIGIVLVTSTIFHLFLPVLTEYYKDIFLNNAIDTYMEILGFIYLLILFVC